MDEEYIIDLNGLFPFYFLFFFEIVYLMNSGHNIWIIMMVLCSVIHYQF